MSFELRTRALKNTTRMKKYRCAKELYGRDMGPDEILKSQLDSFNEQWRRCVQNIPFYRRWAADHDLPDSLGSIGELQSFPTLTKGTLTRDFDEVCEGLDVDGYYSTGGSTGTPARFPKSNIENADRYADIFAARSWIGIKPGASYVHLWGHSHLYGTGARAKPAKFVRALKDWGSAGIRLNAYDLSLEANERYARLISSYRPEYLIGYTSALVRIASIADVMPSWSPPSSLRAAIITAETASASDLAIIEKVFRVPCHVEYGAAETGVIAHSTTGNRNLRTLWDSHLVTTNTDSEIRITTLQSRLFPLVNYELGDRIKPAKVAGESVLEIEKIEGRAQEAVSVPTIGGGHTRASAIMIVHICKALGPAISVQVFNDRDGALHVCYTSQQLVISDMTPANIVRELDRSGIVADLLRIDVLRIERPILSSAGKLRVLLTSSEGEALLGRSR